MKKFFVFLLLVLIVLGAYWFVKNKNKDKVKGNENPEEKEVIPDYAYLINDKGIFSNYYQKSYELLKDHPINKERIKAGKNPANSIWLWGEGTKPALQSFKERYNIEGSVISRDFFSKDV